MSILMFFLTSRIGRLIGVAAIMLVLGFGQGWAVKARLDRSATLQTIITKQKIDLKAATDTADQANAVAAKLSTTDAKNQEIIRDLQKALDQKPPAAGCTIDDPAADWLRRLR